MTDTTASTIPAPLVLRPGEGELIEAHGVRMHLLAAAPRLTVADYVAPAGFPGPPLHVHPGYDELFLVLEGALAMRVGDAAHTLGPGASAFVAGETPHTFANETGAPVRFLAILAPGGFEDYFRALAAGDEDAAMAAGARFGYRPV
jgi:mannose-6-phosphate isomerase-like protein (cupin superfamily)